MEQAIVALPRVIALDRKKVRQRFEQRFSATRMAKDYVDVYRGLLESSKSASGDGRREPRHQSPDSHYAINFRPQIA